MMSDMAEERDEVLLYYKPRDNLPYCELIWTIRSVYCRKPGVSSRGLL